MAYESVHLETVLAIETLSLVHYFQYMSDFFLSRGSHDFWELVCVDWGEDHLVVASRDRQLALKRGTSLFHKPNEFTTC